MSCKKWEESVYLYHELTVDERKHVDVHLQQCVECRVLFESLKQMQQGIQQVVPIKAVIKDRVLLTKKIMIAIPSASTNRKVTDVITMMIDGLFTRYALAAVSLLLIFFFINEQRRKADIHIQLVMNSESKPRILLNTKEFMKVIKQERMKPEVKSLYLCIKSNQCEYRIVKYYKQIKNNENI